MATTSWIPSVIRRKRRWWAWAGLILSIGAVIVAAYPWGALVWHPHWDRVAWIPFMSAPVRPLDLTANLVLCAPIGMCAGRLFTRGIIASAAITMALSLGVETIQLYSHGRFPSATDVVCNVAGAVFAAASMQRYRLGVTSEVRS